MPAKEKHQMEKKNTNENRSITTFKGDFEAIYGIIASHRDRVVKQVNGESVMMVWEVGGFVSGKLKTSAWGSGVVRQLAEYIHTQDPTVRGWSYRTIYKMVQFYETYSSPAFIELIGKVKSQQIVPFEMAQIPNSQIVPIQSAQIARVEVYDTNGRLIHSQAITEQVTAIDAEDWAEGVYVWKVYTTGVSTSSTTLAETGKWVKK